MASLISAKVNLKGTVSFQEQAEKFVHNKKKSTEKGKEKIYVFSDNMALLIS